MGVDGRALALARPTSSVHPSVRSSASPSSHGRRQGKGPKEPYSRPHRTWPCARALIREEALRERGVTRIRRCNSWDLGAASVRDRREWGHHAPMGDRCLRRTTEVLRNFDYLLYTCDSEVAPGIKWRGKDSLEDSWGMCVIVHDVGRGGGGERSDLRGAAHPKKSGGVGWCFV